MPLRGAARCAFSGPTSPKIWELPPSNRVGRRGGGVLGDNQKNGNQKGEECDVMEEEAEDNDGGGGEDDSDERMHC